MKDNEYMSSREIANELNMELNSIYQLNWYKKNKVHRKGVIKEIAINEINQMKLNRNNRIKWLNATEY